LEQCGAAHDVCPGCEAYYRHRDPGVMSDAADAGLEAAHFSRL